MRATYDEIDRRSPRENQRDEDRARRESRERLAAWRAEAVRYLELLAEHFDVWFQNRRD